MVNVEVADATNEHCKFIAENMRQQDLREITASIPLTAIEIVEVSIKASKEPKTLLLDGDPAVVGGIGSISFADPRHGVPWLLSTAAVQKHPLVFIKQIKRYFNTQRHLYDLLENYVHEDNDVSIRFIRAMGYELEDKAKPFGWKRENFYRFYKNVRREEQDV